MRHIKAIGAAINGHRFCGESQKAQGSIDLGTYGNVAHQNRG